MAAKRPFRELGEWEQRFEEMFGRPFWPAWWEPVEEKGWTPAIDVFEKDDRFVVKAELPGMDEKDIDVSIAGDALVIRGEKVTETEVKKEEYYSCERAYGSFSRSIPLPSTVDTNKIEASYENGVLEVTMPKAVEVKPKKVTVSAKKEAGK